MTDTVLEEVRRAVAACIPGDAVLRIRAVATHIAAQLNDEHVSLEAIAEHLMEAGVAAGIPIEFDTAAAKAR